MIPARSTSLQRTVSRMRKRPGGAAVWSGSGPARFYPSRERPTPRGRSASSSWGCIRPPFLPSIRVTFLNAIQSATQGREGEGLTVSLQTIVVGTSLSAVSDGIVRTGVAVARATGAAVWLVHVCAPAALPPEIRKGDSRRLGQQLE